MAFRGSDSPAELITLWEYLKDAVQANRSIGSDVIGIRHPNRARQHKFIKKLIITQLRKRAIRTLVRRIIDQRNFKISFQQI
jgi:hypothetical protein